MASIRDFGFTNPILVDPESVIITGHGRLRVALELGLDDVPTIVLGGLSDAQKRALRLAGNTITGADWDLDILGRDLANPSDLSLELGLSLTGF